jgi:RimJ/RimL family protein N-acetyltransferase
MDDRRREKIIVRPVREHEWREVRSLRLRALQDEVARIAFVDTFEEASSRPDEFWQARAAGASLEARSDAAVRQFVAVTEGGTWIGSATVIIEHAGDKDFLGAVIQRSAGGIVGVYLDPAFRGHGTIQRLFDAAIHWVRERGLDSARLYVHVENLRAQKAYEKLGFRATGTTLLGSVGPELEMAREV